jgi:hypothetical protein
MKNVITTKEIQEFKESLNIFMRNQKRIAAIREIAFKLLQLPESGFTDKQRLDILIRILYYIKLTDYGNRELQQETSDIQKIHIVNKETLETLMQEIFSELPKRLATIDNEKWLKTICELIPSAPSKAETVELIRDESQN